MFTSLDAKDWLQVLALAGAAIGFIWSAVRYADSRKTEAARPFLDLQLSLYTTATQMAAKISSPSSDSREVADATKRFWELYWGELALVEDRGVEAAMVRFGRELAGTADKKTLQQLSLGLAFQCRLSLSQSWNVEVWRQETTRS